ncbi:hypothetical protein Ato02nite_071170 [Paractinoplanes toevensis]|uniref:Uncharacterized protein n=1 Tax=Paractinoplanes toevensis TaxID=571911 RepID=A0A919TJL2_9ACTN|nr:hypothetical protein Ato02nite_071170 [Actinoplanes toevensis]
MEDGRQRRVAEPVTALPKREMRDDEDAAGRGRWHAPERDQCRQGGAQQQEVDGGDGAQQPVGRPQLLAGGVGGGIEAAQEVPGTRPGSERARGGPDPEELATQRTAYEIGRVGEAERLPGRLAA